MIPRKLVLLGLSLVLAGVLAGCKSSQERAEGHFRSAVELIEAGDTDRGLVELRNALQLDERHRDARLLFARTILERGEVGPAIGQYRRFVEFYPDDFEGRIALAELSLQVGDWDELARHLTVAQGAQPDDIRVRILTNAQGFRNALENREDAANEPALVEEARALVAEAPDNLVPRQVLINGLLRQGRLRDGLAQIDAALALEADNFELHRARLTVLNELGEADLVETQLRDMITRFPDRTEPRSALLQWYMARKETDKAESFLRELAQQSGEQGYADLVRFLLQTRGPDAAIAELDGLIAGQQETAFYRALRAGIDFDRGNRSEAIAELEDILKTATPSEQTRKIKVTLARLRWSTGNAVGARELVEEVLAEDPTQVEAMKLKAAWLTEDDKTDEAILLLRSALEQSPQDAQIYTLMAQAYERSGAQDLLGEMLSRAAEVSNNAAAESQRYARFLAADDKLVPAEQVLIDALRRAPSHVGLLRDLGGIYVRLEDWPRLTQVIDTLGRLPDDPAAAGLQKDLRLTMLRAQDKEAEALNFLSGLSAADGEEGARALYGIIRTHMQGGSRDKARTALDEALGRYPDSLVFQAMDARLLELDGDADKAIGIYRGLLAQNDKLADIWRELYATLRRAGRDDEATAALDAGIAAVPEASTLQWVKASLLETAGDVDGAIAIYEQLYEQNSSNLIVVNNLASLLTAHRDDDASLERAYTVARRLRGNAQPYFRDTYGWIAYRRGDLEDALEHLEPAAASGVPEPVIHYHLGMTYIALKRFDEAEAQLVKAVEMAGPANTSREIEAARTALAGLVSGETQKDAEAGSGQ